MNSVSQRFAGYTWRYQLPADVLLAMSFGVLDLAGFVAKRAFGAADWVVPVLVTAAQVPWLLAPVWEVVFARLDPRRVFVWVGAIAKLPLLLIGLTLITGHESWLWPFLGVIALHHLMIGAYLPHRGALLRANYASTLRARILSKLEIAAMLAFLCATKLAGFALDHDDASIAILFPIAAVLGFAGFLVLARIRWRRDGEREPPSARRDVGEVLRDVCVRTYEVLKADRDFRRYEIGYMLYGVGLLSGAPLIILMAEGPLAMKYGEWADARGIAFPAAYIVGMLFIGRVADRLGPVRVTVIAFAVLAAFFACVTVVQTPWQLVASFVLYGVAMSFVTIGWTLGPLHFAPPGRARRYAGVHVFLVGVRSAPAPFLGLWLASAFSLRVGFAVSAVLVAVGGVVVYGLLRTEVRSGLDAR